MKLSFHVAHRYQTVERISYAEYRQTYGSQNPPPPKNPIPPGRYDGVIAGVALQECKCGARRTKDIIEPFPPIDSWTRRRRK